MKKEHDLHCAVHPEDCPHSSTEITKCVICGKTLVGNVHLDTCSTPCFKELLKIQRQARRGEEEWK